MSRMSQNIKARIVVIIGLSATASVLILLIPRLFDSPSAPQVWAAVVLAVMAAGFGGAALALRPPRSASGQR